MSLLPKEYCDGVLGVSWPVILLTAVLGVIICWILMWRSSAAKRLRKELAYDMNVEELRSQIVKMMKEKLGSENELEDLRVEVSVCGEQRRQINYLLSLKLSILILVIINIVFCQNFLNWCGIP